MSRESKGHDGGHGKMTKGLEDVNRKMDEQYRKKCKLQFKIHLFKMVYFEMFVVLNPGIQVVVVTWTQVEDLFVGIGIRARSWN